MLIFKFDIMEKLKEKGITTYQIRQKKLIGENALTQIRKGIVPGTKSINMLCSLLEMQPGSFLRYVPDDHDKKIES